MRHHSLDFTGTWGVGLQALCLAISTCFILVSKGEDCFLYSAIAFICISRLGLWVIDITVTQLQQQEIPEEYRCLMGGVQEAINACFHVIAFVLGLLFPDPNDFIFISLSGCLFVSLAFVVFFFGMYLPRRKKQTSEFILPNTNHPISITCLGKYKHLGKLNCETISLLDSKNNIKYYHCTKSGHNFSLKSAM